MKLDKLGWIVASALAGGMFVMGFQGPTQKIGSIDMERAFSESKYLAGKKDDLRGAQETRRAILQFIGDNKAMKTEDAARYAELASKPAPTAADKSEIERITRDAAAAANQQKALATKPNLTPAETAQMSEFTSRMNQNNELMANLSGQFGMDIQNLQTTLRADLVDRIRAAVREVAAKQGYSVVFTNEYAPYTANDVTDDALKAMNSKK